MRCFLLVRYFLMFYWMSEVGPTCFAATPTRPIDQGKKKKTEAADAPHQSRVRFCGPGPREELVHQAQGPVGPTMLTSANKAKNRLSFCEPGPPEQLVHQAQGTPCMPTSANKEVTAKESEIEELEAPVPDHKEKQKAAASCGPGPRDDVVHQAQGARAKAKKNGKSGETTFFTKIFMKWFYPRLIGPARLAPPRQRRSSPPSSQGVTRETVKLEAPVLKPLAGPFSCPSQETNEASTSQQRDAPRQRHVRFAEQVMVYSYDVSSASAKPKLDGLIPLARESEIEELEAPVAAHRQQNKAKRRVSLFSCFGAPSSVKKAGSKPKCWACLP